MIGGFQLHLFTPDIDLSFIRFIHSEQHTHQGGFSCTIFSQKGKDLSLFDLDRHIVIGYDPGKTFGDVFHLNNIFRHVHPHFCTFSCLNSSLNKKKVTVPHHHLLVNPFFLPGKGLRSYTVKVCRRNDLAFL